jgi:hypothetical protein
MIHSLDSLIAGSPESQLISYSFESKELRFQLFHSAASGLLTFFVPTDTVYGRTVSADPKRSVCRIALFDLARDLPIKSGRYTPPEATQKLFDHARDRLTLAYGRRATDCRWLFSLKNDITLLACLVQDLPDIRWTHD